MIKSYALQHRSIKLGLPLLLLGAMWFIPAAPVAAESLVRYELADLKALQNAFIDLADQVRPGVVSIRCYQVHASDQEDAPLVKLPISQGSGFIIDPQGFIATNNHVIDGADFIAVILHNGIAYEGKLQQRDQRTDLAVLKIEGAEDLQPVRFGDLSKVRVNQWAFASGNPFGMAFDNNGHASVTFGVISALGRQMTHRLAGDPLTHYYGNLIETSATINPGNSGGPLFNIDGEVIGVVTAIETSSGVSEGHGFAIPIDRNTRRVFDTLMRGEVVRYGFLGIQVADVTAAKSRFVTQVKSPGGAEIAGISPPNAPAAKAGLMSQDVIIEFNGIPVIDSDHLVRLVQFSPVGAEAEVTFIRRGVKQRTTVVLGDRNELLGLASAGR
jgi:serine protease Do